MKIEKEKEEERNERYVRKKEQCQKREQALFL